MSDSLDELLARLPQEPMAADLVARAQARVAAHRRRARRWRWAGRLALAAAGLFGAWLAVPALGNVAGRLAAPSSEGLLRWLADLAASPLTAAAGLVDGTLAWREGALAGGSGALWLGLALLGCALAWLTVRLLQAEAPSDLEAYHT